MYIYLEWHWKIFQDFMIDKHLLNFIIQYEIHNNQNGSKQHFIIDTTPPPPSTFSEIYTYKTIVEIKMYGFVVSVWLMTLV